MPRPPWPPATRLGDDLGVDSLEALQLATALGEAIELDRSGIDDALLSQTTIGDWIETVARSLDHFAAELTFRTSGSTGQPKWCRHELADLEAEIDALAPLFAGSRRVISAVPSHHIYGFLFTILLPGRLAAAVVDVRASAPSRLAGLLAPGDVVIAYPAFWRAFVRTVPRAGSGVTGVTSTAPCPSELASAVVAHGVSRLIDVYGSSETAGIGWRDDPRGAYELFAHWRRGGADSELVRTLPSGAERIATVPDRLLWDDARHVRPAGRLEGAVQVGGINVFPDRVAAALARQPGVAAAAVRRMQAGEGERLKAFIVPREPDADPERLRADLWTWIDSNLSVPERPKSIVFGPRLPTGALGKPADWALFEEPPPVGGFEEPPPVGGFEEPPPVGGFEEPPPVGGFEEPPPLGDFEEPS